MEGTFQCPLDKTKWNIWGMYDAETNSWDISAEQEIRCPLADKWWHKILGRIWDEPMSVPYDITLTPVGDPFGEEALKKEMEEEWVFDERD